MKRFGGSSDWRVTRLVLTAIVTVALVACGGESAGDVPPESPVAAFTLTPTEGAAPLKVEVDAGESNTRNGRITSYSWKFGDGAKSSGVTATHTYTTTGEYTIELTVTNDKGGTDQHKASVTVTEPKESSDPAPENLPPIAEFTATPASGPAPLTVVFDASMSHDPDGSITAYAWEFGDGLGDSGLMVSHLYGKPGNYTVTLTITDNDGATAQQTTTVIVSATGQDNESPVAMFSLSPEGGEAPLAVKFDATTSHDPDGTITNFDWEFGDGETGSGQVVNHMYEAAGEYTITLTVTDDKGVTSQHAKGIDITAVREGNERPTATFSLTPPEGEAPLTIVADATESTDPDGWITTFDWDFGDGGTANGVTANHTYLETGTYTITLVITDNQGETATSNATLQVMPAAAENEAPVATFAMTPDTGEAPLAVEFDASASSDPDGTITTYAWAFGDGGMATGVTGNHIYVEAGTYTITLTVTDDDGTSSQATKMLTVTSPAVNQPPTSAFTMAPETGRAPLTVYLNAAASNDPDGTITSYEWNFGDETAGTGVTTSHTFNSPGAHTITLTVTDDAGAADVTSRQVMVSPPNQAPTAAFTTTTNDGEAPLEVTFDASASSDPDGTITSYDWDLGDGTTGSGTVITHTYEHPGLYSPTLTITDNLGATASEQAFISAFTWEKDPTFEHGLIAAHDIDIGGRLLFAVNLWAGGSIDARNADMVAGFKAEAGQQCRLRQSVCFSDAPPPMIPLVNFFEIRDRVVADLLGDPGFTDIGAVCGLALGGGSSVICLGAGETLVLDGAYPEIVVIGHETSRIEIRGTIGNDTGRSIIIGGSLTNHITGTLIGDVTVVSIQGFRMDGELLANPTGQRPALMSEGDIELGGNSEEKHAILWSGGSVRINGRVPTFIGTIVARGDISSTSGGLDEFRLPESVNNPYLPKAALY